MSGPTIGSNSQSDRGAPAAECIAAERAALPVQRPVTQPRTFHTTQPKPLSRRAHAPMLRQTPSALQRPPEAYEATSDSAAVETNLKHSMQNTDLAQRPLIHILNRTGRLTFDALLLIVFAPVIAIWWLNEKRRKH